MEFKIIVENENPLFNRKEIEGEIYSDVVPSRIQITDILAKEFSVNPEVIKIKTIKGKFGKRIFLIVANIYKSKEEKEKIEKKKKKDIELEKKQEMNQKSKESQQKEIENIESESNKENSKTEIKDNNGKEKEIK